MGRDREGRNAARVRHAAHSAWSHQPVARVDGRQLSLPLRPRLVYTTHHGNEVGVARLDGHIHVEAGIAGATHIKVVIAKPEFRKGRRT